MILDKKKILEIQVPELPGNSVLGISLASGMCISTCLVSLTHGLPNNTGIRTKQNSPSPHQDML